MIRSLLAAALLACGSAAGVAAPVPLPGARDAVAIGPYAEVFEDPGGALTFERVVSAGRFVPLEREVANFGYSYSAYWLRFSLPQASGALLAPILAIEIRFPSLDSIELYVPYQRPRGIEYVAQRGGDQLPWNAREVKHRNHVFRVPLAGIADAPAYLRVQSGSVLTIPAFLWRPEAMIAADRHSHFAYGIFYGLVLALFLYNLMLLLSLRDRIYLWYVLYVGSFGLALATFDGFSYQYLWPGSVWWANHALATAFCSALLFGAQFARSFLGLAAFSIFANRFLIAVMGLAAAGMFFSATGLLVSYGTVMRAVSVVASATAAIVLAVSVRAMLGGYQPARFFLLAWSALLVFIALGALRNFALVPTHFLTVNGLHIGLALDILLLSFALADRINALERASADAQSAARERERVVEQLRHMAQHDPLTGLPNRTSMQQRLALAVEIAKRNRKKLAVMLVDLNDFKLVNDSRGHPVGDHVLAAVAGRLRASVRGSDTVARYGGDEFVVLAGELDRAEDAGHIAEKIADMVGVPLPVDGAVEKVGCSIGISVYPDDAGDPDALIERADRAMYAAKAEKNRRYAYFSGA
ncbi:MAG: GGDEF domain-containing protein [Burkholderiales bacterium]|nr:GGDEF domain-containing protein [Burkholderiales bacterium]